MGPTADQQAGHTEGHCGSVTEARPPPGQPVGETRVTRAWSRTPGWTTLEPTSNTEQLEGAHEVRSVRVIGPGRVGRSFMSALAGTGWQVEDPRGRNDDLRGAAHGVDLLIITTPDDVIRRAAALVEPVPTTVVAHASGAHTLDVLGGHPRRASIHPLASLPDGTVGAERLRGGCTFALDGDPLVAEVVDSLGGRSFVVPAEHRVTYHAAAAIAANHLVALLGQVERVAETAGVPLDAYLDLAAQTLENVRRLGPAAALTGPVARGDWATVARHLGALEPEEAPAYRAMADLAARLVSPDGHAHEDVA